MSNEDHGPSMWSTEPLGGKADTEEDVSPGAKATLGGDPFGLSGTGATGEDVPHDEAAHRERERHDVTGRQSGQPTTPRDDVVDQGGGLGQGHADPSVKPPVDPGAELGADRQGFGGPGNPGSVANSGTD